MAPLGKKLETGTRRTWEETEQLFTKQRSAALERALQTDKVRYKSSVPPQKFINFLEGRLHIWEQLKDKTFHGKRMFEKTNEILSSLKN